EELLLDNCLGREEKLPERVKQYSCLQYFLAPKAGRLDSVEFPNAPEVVFRATFLPPGAELKGEDTQLSYLRCYLTVMPSFDAALERSKAHRDRIRVNGTFGGVF